MERQTLQTSLSPAIPTINSCFKTGLYTRLSKDDLQKGESISIETQKLILEKFCKEHGLNIVDCYVDDGYSGTTFDRPDFNRMIGDIESGKINCVITKDLSRLGRDYIQTGTYIELYFTGKNVRYIAVDDGFDTGRSDTTNDIMMPIRNLFNEWYVRDISKKIRNAKRQRAEAGKFVCSQPPYGYLKDPADKNHLIIDEEVADVVREIFKMVLNGDGVVKIARALTARQILIPSAYKTSRGVVGYAFHQRNKPAGRKQTWGVTTVQSILRNPVYAGDMEGHKLEKISYKHKKCRNVPKNQRILVKNTHEPIVSREDFNAVQELMTARHHPVKYNDENVLKSVVYCKSCGSRLTICGKSQKSGKRNTWYRCFRNSRRLDTCDTGNNIAYKTLVAIVAERIREKIALFADDESIPKIIAGREADTKRDDRFKSEKQAAESRLATLKNLMRRLYEDYASDVLTLDNYQGLLNGYQEEQTQLNGRISEIDRILADSKDDAENYRLFKETLLKFADFETLDCTIVNTLIERIEVGPKTLVEGKAVREIDIYFRFIGK